MQKRGKTHLTGIKGGGNVGTCSMLRPLVEEKQD